jgi:hypothetical protein
VFVCVQEKKERELQGKNEREAAAILASISSGGEGGEGGGRGGEEGGEEDGAGWDTTYS